MAPEKTPLSSSIPIAIGDCEVIVEANKFTCKYDPSSLQISVPRIGKVTISVRKEVHMKSGKDSGNSISKKGEGERASISEDDYMFVLVNPKEADNNSKSYTQEVLDMYTKELPTMKYAAGTGKQSTFLEKTVSNGKYNTLLLKSNSMEGSEVIIAAMTFQIVPADTQYAEIPLAAVRSIYQNKGFGSLLFKELRQRLQSVGILSIFCWGDKESEGFWLKQGFEIIAEVDPKGRARKLPIKANIRRSLCFPGGSSLMLNHLTMETLATPSIGKHDNTLKSLSQTVPRTESYPPAGLEGDGSLRDYVKLDGFSDCPESLHGDKSCDIATLDRVHCTKMDDDTTKLLADTDIKDCSFSIQGAKRKAWGASLSSLKSKKLKGTHQNDCHSEPNYRLVSDNERKRLTNKLNLELSPVDPLSFSSNKSDSESRPVGITSECRVRRELWSTGKGFKIMLMDIGDDTKKAHLTKVIEYLGGSVTSDGSLSTHVVTGKVRKTLNFCMALCSGAWVVTFSWLKQSVREGRFADEHSHMLKDEDYKLKHRTELKFAVLKARAAPQALLKGYSIRIAAHVEPNVSTLSAIVRSAGGNIIRGLDITNEASRTIFIAGEEDMEEALSAIKKGIRTFSSEWLMNSVMKQELDLDAPQFAESL